MKKLFIGFIFSVVVSTGIFAQSNNVLAGGGAGLSFPSIGYIGFNASYERMIIPKLSVSVNAGWNMYPVVALVVVFMENPSITGWVIDAQAHWYPWAKTFHVDMGAGYGGYLGMNCIVIVPGLGWKIDFGKPGGFIMNIGIREELYIPVAENIFKYSDRDDSLKPSNFDIRIGLGYSF